MSARINDDEFDAENEWIDDNGDHHLARYDRNGNARYVDRRMWGASAPAPKKPLQEPQKAKALPRWLRDEMDAASDLARSLGR